MLREQIVAEIMKLVRQEPVRIEPKPTIAEIEKILNSDNPGRIQILPDGSIATVPPAHTVGDIADAVLRVIGPVRTLALVEARAKIQAECPACEGSGHSSDSTEDDPRQCQYCGVPQSAITKMI